jgi:hypothetical protein
MKKMLLIALVLFASINLFATSYSDVSDEISQVEYLDVSKTIVVFDINHQLDERVSIPTIKSNDLSYNENITTLSGYYNCSYKDRVGWSSQNTNNYIYNIKTLRDRSIKIVYEPYTV